MDFLFQKSTPNIYNQQKESNSRKHMGTIATPKPYITINHHIQHQINDKLSFLLKKKILNNYFFDER